jgi:hypothetical protein
MARSTGTNIRATASENNANMNPFNPAKSFDIPMNIYIHDITQNVDSPMKEDTLLFWLCGFIFVRCIDSKHPIFLR